MSLVLVAAVGMPSSSARADDTPDLQISKTNSANGELMLGGAFNWSLKVANLGSGDATFAAGETILTDTLPDAGAGYGEPGVESVDNVTGHPNIRCSITGNDLTCTASGGDVVIGATTGTFSVSLLVTPTVAGSLVNPRLGGACRVDPDTIVAESDDENNDCADTVTVTQPNLQVIKVNDVGTTAPVQTAITWTWTVTNVGTGPATFNAGKVLLRDDLPDVGGTYADPTKSGSPSVPISRINCTIVSDDLTCTATGTGVTIPAGSQFTVQVAFSANVPGTLTNPRQNGSCAVDPDGAVTESNEADNTCSDAITILGPELRVSKTNDVAGATTVGRPWTWTWTVTNTGSYQATFGSGKTILFDQLPTGGVAYGDPTIATVDNVAGAGHVSCSISNDDLICVASDGPVAIGASNGRFTVTATVTPTIDGTFKNPRQPGVCTVDGTNQAKELDESNNSCADTVTVSPTQPDLLVSKSNSLSGPATVGTDFTWALTIANTGGGTATFTTGQTILTDELPSDGATYGNLTLAPGSVDVTGAENIRCTVVSNALSCTASGGTVTIGGTTGTFTVNLPVTPTAAGTLGNPRIGGTCKVDPTGPNGVVTETDETNNTCSNSVTVVARPDLKVTKSNNVSGQSTEGSSWTWTWLVQNTGGSDATFAALENILRDQMPSTGLTYDGPTVSDTVNVSGSGTLTCARQGVGVAPHLSCTATGGSVVLGANGSFTVSVTVTASNPGTYQSSFCAADPDGVVAESDEANNGCADGVGVTALSSDLKVSKTNNVGGSTTLGTSFAWSITVTNVGSGDARFHASDVILIDQLPTGLNFGPVVVGNTNLPSGSAVTCGVSGPVFGPYALQCVAASAETTIPREGGGFTVTVPVTPTTAGAFVNPRPDAVPGCKADPGGLLTETSLSNNTCADTVTVTAPDLQVSKANNVGGTVAVNSPFTWALTVSNTGSATATFADGQTILTDDLPISGATYGTPTVGDLAGITGSGTITCSIAGTTLSCGASGGSATIGASTGTFTVSLPVTPTAAGPLANPASPDGCKVDPIGTVTESIEENNTCTDTVTVSAEQPDLRITTTNNVSGSTTVGTGFAWALTVANGGSAAATFTTGQTILTDELPGDGATYGAPTIDPTSVNVTGAANIGCAVASDVLTCTANGAGVTIGGTTGAFTVTLPVTPTAAGTLSNPRVGGACKVDPSGVVAEHTESNNDCNPNSVTVAGTPNLQVTHAASVGSTAVVGTEFDWSWTVANVGGGPATFSAGQTILRDNLPSSGATYKAPSIPSSTDVVGIENVTCTVVTNDLACTVSSGSVTLGATTGSFKVTVATTPTTAGALVNPRSPGACAVDPGGVVGESSESDNDCAQTLTVVTPADLLVTKSNDTSGSAAVGSSWNWTWVIANAGGAGATFAQGTPILVDHLPSGGLTYGTPSVGNPVNVSGVGTVQCTIAVTDLSCVATGGAVVLGSSGSLTVSVPVTPTTTGTFVNPRTPGECTVDPSHAVTESSETNNACSDTVIVSTTLKPDLQVQKTNNVGGNATVGIPFTWSLTVANTGSAAATFAQDQTILTDSLPQSGATYGTTEVGSLTGVTNGGNIRCDIATGALECKASGGSVTIGAATGRFTVNLPVTPTAVGTLTNPRTGGPCVVDRDNSVAESDESNNSCGNSLTVSPAPQPDLRVSATNTVGGAASAGSPFDWMLTVTNTGTGPATFSNGQTILIDHLPSSGTSYLTPTVGSFSGVTGSGTITCSVAGTDLICTATGGSVTLGAASGGFKVTVPVRPTAAGTLTNPRAGGVCAVDPNGVVAENNESNNLCADTVILTASTPPPAVPTPIVPVPTAPIPTIPDLQIRAASAGPSSAALGSSLTWTLTVVNTGTGPATFAVGQVILLDHLPGSGATYGRPAVTSAANVDGAANVECAVTNSALACTASGGSVTLGATGGTFTVTIPVTPTAIGTLVNPAPGGVCAVDPTGVIAESDDGNNACGINTTVGRPTVAITTVRGGPGTLNATIAVTGPGNTLHEIRVGEVRNATVTIDGQEATANSTVPLPGNPAGVVVTVTRASAGSPALVPLVVVDDFGAWPTFVGGGPEAF